jgi:hypothetical protein
MKYNSKYQTKLSNDSNYISKHLNLVSKYRTKDSKYQTGHSNDRKLNSNDLTEVSKCYCFITFFLIVVFSVCISTK